MAFYGTLTHLKYLQTKYWNGLQFLFEIFRGRVNKQHVISMREAEKKMLDKNDKNYITTIMYSHKLLLNFKFCWEQYKDKNALYEHTHCQYKHFKYVLLSENLSVHHISDQGNFWGHGSCDWSFSVPHSNSQWISKDNAAFAADIFEILIGGRWLSLKQKFHQNE